MADPRQVAGREFHLPVLRKEVVELLRPAAGKLFLDGTIGDGGHAQSLLEAGATVIGCDQDPEAVERAAKRLARFGDRIRLVESNFGDVAAGLIELRIAALDGVLLDLGVSLNQLNDPARGFSFQTNGPLDMRMNPRAERSAADLVNHASQEELTRIFVEFGEEPAAKRLAAHLVKWRSRYPIRTTQDLVQIVESVIPRHGPKHPATKVFQALRIAVNRELSVLERALRELSGWINPGGRMAVIAFHSLEDRIVKRYFREVSQEWIDRPEWPGPKRNPVYGFRLITSRPVVPGDAEIVQNPRARSAKLRVVERINHES